MRIVQRATPGAAGFDTDTVLTAASCAALRAAGMAFVVRYLRDLSPIEAATILASGLALMGVGHVRWPGWRPSQGMGAIDGANALQGARAAALAVGTTCWCDLEGVADDVTAADAAGYVNAWAASVRAGGYEPGLYVGFQSVLSSSQLFHSITVSRYWRSGSSVPDVEERGYCLVQCATDVTVAGVKVDRDVVQADHFGDVPSWTAEVPDVATA